MRGDFLTPAEVADYLGLSVQTLYGWRYRGIGPPGYRINGRVRYRRSDVERWIEEQADSKVAVVGDA